MRPRGTYLEIIFLCALTASASADPVWVTWPENGHEYAVVSVPAGISWADANAAAQTLAGELASINSAAENDFVFTLIDDALFWKPHTSFTAVDFNIGPWIGGYQPAGASEPDGDWLWTTNEGFNFKTWHPGEPNEGPVPGELTENRACYWVRGSLTDRGNQWNDFHDGGCWDGDCVISFVVERGCVSSSITGPAAQSLCLGSTASFTVTPNGGGSFTYQWQKAGQTLTDDARITGSSEPTLIITDLTISDAGTYACLVTDLCGPALSPAADLLITSITAVNGPSTQAICMNEIATFTVAPAGLGPFTFAWRKDGQPLADDAHVSGSTTETLSINGATAYDVASYSCLIANGCGSILSDAAELTITSVVMVDGPLTQTVCLGGTAVFFITTSEPGAFTYAWQKGGQALVDNGHVTGSNTTTLTINGATATDMDDYACLVTGSCLPVLSAAADLLVIPAVNIDGPSSQAVCAAGNASFAVTVTPVGSGPHTYAWQKAGQPLIDDTHITGANEPILSITGVTSVDVATYACLITGPCGSMLSDTADLTIIAGVSMDGPSSQSVCAGSIASFMVAATGSGPFGYAWQRNGQPLTDDAHLTGSASDTLTISNTTASDGASYACLVTGVCGSALSASAELVVLPVGSGDGDASGTIDGLDIAGFAAALTGDPSATPAYCAYDMNGNGSVTPDDLPAFVATLLGE